MKTHKKERFVMLKWNKNKVYNDAYFWIPFLIIMYPTFPSTISFGSQIVFVINILVLLWFGYVGGFKYKISPGIIIYGGYFVMIACYDVFLEMVRNNIEPNDFLEILRPIGFLLCYLFYRYSNVDLNKIEQQTLKMIYWTFTIISIYCILEFIFPDSIREISFLLWKRRDVPILKTKAIGPFFQTYNHAYALLIPIFFAFITLFKRFVIKNVLFFLLLLCTLLLTQSRSMYVCTGIGFVICILTLTDFNSPKSLVRTFTIVGIVLIALLALYFTYEDDIRANLGYAIQGLEAMSEGNSTSVNARQAQIEWAIDNNVFPLIGGGIGKGEVLLESIYALYYFRYGWIGLLIFFSLVLYAAFISYKVSTVMKEPFKSFYQALFVFFLMNPIALTSSCHMDMPKTCLLFYGMVGLVFNRYEEEKVIPKNNKTKSTFLLRN